MNEIKKYLVKIQNQNKEIDQIIKPEILMDEYKKIDKNHWKQFSDKLSFKIQILNMKIVKNNDISYYYKLKNYENEINRLIEEIKIIFENLNELNKFLKNKLKDVEKTHWNKDKFLSLLNNN